MAVSVLWRFPATLWVGLQHVIVAFPGHINFFAILFSKVHEGMITIFKFNMIATQRLPHKH